MPKLYSARVVLQAPHRAGFQVISQKGSHIKLRAIREGKLHTRGTFSSILSQADMTKAEFETFLR
ncbi:hypothetical protein A3D77_01280 [Candidatus Gottesmanbacteria bacterium RIFCSPHIGHO2_02_FULL_39_11]|uniref:Type II toxin-antitoxin system HicA family toxin n=1 Tax=Candidatus Gottesmanbacteria bacterium RIFCSPHIGHO2_02_FULL_39_11 TaxID=1798382 RepID=A0A1F5ZU45_9BACT|nr:MAG: hypothetical protein A3D77_01280 [Candidatus Gottesmanbacteria bacterium RIFCSPHIGHO2_02_FULL_39_11]